LPPHDAPSECVRQLKSLHTLHGGGKTFPDGAERSLAERSFVEGNIIADDPRFVAGAAAAALQDALVATCPEAVLSAGSPCEMRTPARPTAVTRAMRATK